MAKNEATHTHSRLHKAKAANPREGKAQHAVAAEHAVMIESLPAPPAHELLEGPTRDDMIRLRAYDIYERNGRVDGRDVDDWLRAEAEITKKAKATPPPRQAARQDTAMA